MRFTRQRGRVALIATALLVAAFAAGCGGDTTAADPASSSSPARSDPATASGSASPTTSPSPTGVPAATGPLITMKSFTVNAPDGWQIYGVADPERSAASDPTKPVGTLLLSSYEDLGDLGPDFQLMQAHESAKIVLGHEPTREPDRTLDGVAGFVFSGSNADYPTYYQFSTVHEHYISSVTIELNATLDDPQAFVDAVLNSLTFVTPPPPGS